MLTTFGYGQPNMAKRSVVEELASFGVMFSPAVYRAVEQVCKDAIAYSSNHPGLRRSMVQLCHELRIQAEASIGYHSPEVISLMQLLRRTDPALVEKPVSVPSPIELLHKNRQLSLDQVNAANTIRQVWYAFSRFLTVTGTRYQHDPSGGTKRTKVIQPLEVMNEETYETWMTIYGPWASHAVQKKLSTTRGPLNHVSIVLSIVLQDFHPRDLDRAYRLPRNACLTVLRAELDAFGTIPRREKPELPDALLKKVVNA